MKFFIAVLAASAIRVTTYPEYENWKQAAKPDAAQNHCNNINKATGEQEPCSTVGNSAWTTYTSAKTAAPKDAQADPYPAHADHQTAEASREKADGKYYSESAKDPEATSKASEGAANNAGGGAAAADAGGKWKWKNIVSSSI